MRHDLNKIEEQERRHQVDREAITKVLAEDKRREQSETLSVLDVLRRTRKARGGTGAPLAVPADLRDAADGKGVVITDADLDPNDTGYLKL